MFDTVLVANRGEIAVRVLRTLRRLGIRSVAVHSDADADAPHVRAADTAVRIGPTAAEASYLSAERLLEAAARTGAEAIHPGYGFLAENPAFARAVSDAGLTFIGPPSDAIELMGDKVRAKETVGAAGVPVVPGSSGSGLDDAQLTAAARETGLPVLLKPSAGGGGKGMRLVRQEAALAEEIAAARREARSSFGDDTLLVERWVDRPRHIEIQVLADGHGHVVHLGERECSLQRRHQKIVEEAPSPLLDEAMRSAMGEAAVEAARSCGYRGAGTVEFIVPGDSSGAYFFMEMNTRLQVEHPVTEMVTGLDLVEWQVRVAAREPLSFGQSDISLSGHAIEARVCAESARLAGDDSGRVDFLPSAGTVLLLREPGGDGTATAAGDGGPGSLDGTGRSGAPGGSGGPRVRTDSGLAPGTEVGTGYDPMLSKIIAHGPDRATALRRLRAALAETTVLGVETNTGFLRRLLEHPEVAAGTLDTGLVDRAAPALLSPGVPDEVYAAAALLRLAAWEAEARGSAPGAGDTGWQDPFSVPSGWRLGAEPAETVHHLRVPGHHPVVVRVRGHSGDARVRIGEAEPRAATLRHGESAGVGAEFAPGGEPGGHRHGGAAGRGAQGAAGAGASGWLRLEWEGVSLSLAHASSASAAGRWLGLGGDSWHVQNHDPVAAALAGAAGAHGADALTAPMPGTVTVVKAATGDQVTAGQSLLVVEAMKMEHVITAPYDGTVAELDVTAGSTVAMDQVLAVVEPSAGAPEPDGARAGLAGEEPPDSERPERKEAKA
jgi:acetyl-CoA/propionyl-CoA carboxylase biotin carboxyl carrier protein